MNLAEAVTRIDELTRARDRANAHAINAVDRLTQIGTILDDAEAGKPVDLIPAIREVLR